MTASQPNVLVVGAGPVGMTAAIELNRRGATVRIVDKGAARSAHSKAVGINARSLEILEKEYGQDSPFLVPTILNMASLYDETGRENEAQRMMERANGIQASSRQ